MKQKKVLNVNKSNEIAEKLRKRDELNWNNYLKVQ